jgi:hypothetical protein
MPVAVEGQELVEGFQITIAVGRAHFAEEYDYVAAIVAVGSQIAARENLPQMNEEVPQEHHLEGLLGTVVGPAA